MKLKLLQFYTFPDAKGTLDLSGIWETVAAHEMDTPTPKWTIIRRYSCETGSNIGKAETLPEFILTRYAHHVSRVALFGDTPKN